MPSGQGAAKIAEKIRNQYQGRRVRGVAPRAGRSRFVLWSLTALVAAVAVVWAVRPGRVLSPTYDEPHHLATGLEWWQFHESRWWTETPPLPKIAVGLGPHLAGLRLPDKGTWDPKAPGKDPWTVGNELLSKHGGDRQGGDAAGGDAAGMLGLARLGNLPFLLLTLLLTFLLAGGRRRPWAGLVATALVATYPPLLGHAALATTDVATVATTLLFVTCLDRWWQRRRVLAATTVGAAFGLALLCSLTAPLLCGVAAVGWIIGRRLAREDKGESLPSERRFAASPDRAAVPRSVRKPVAWPRPGSVRASNDHPVLMAGLAGLLGVLAAFVVVWAGYRFSIGRIDDLSTVGYLRQFVLPPVGERPAWLAWLCQLPLPAPEVPHGYLFLKTHMSQGHAAYLFGNVSDRGFWNFYLVGFLLKSPLTFLILAVIATLVLVRLVGHARSAAPSRLAAGLAALAVLALSTVGIVNVGNLGLRQLLVVVPLVAIWIAGAVDVLIETVPPRGFRPLAIGTVAVLLAGQAVIVERAEPQLLAYFNPFAGREPGEALIDSDLDWGQDLALLERELATRKISETRVAIFGAGRPCRADKPAFLPLVPGQPATGWIAISENYYRASDLNGLRRDPCDPSTTYGPDEAPADGFAWLRAHTPVARIGASVRLYHIDESSAAVAPAKAPAPEREPFVATPEEATTKPKAKGRSAAKRKVGAIRRNTEP